MAQAKTNAYVGSRLCQVGNRKGIRRDIIPNKEGPSYLNIPALFIAYSFHCLFIARFRLCCFFLICLQLHEQQFSNALFVAGAFSHPQNAVNLIQSSWIILIRFLTTLGKPSMFFNRLSRYFLASEQDHIFILLGIFFRLHIFLRFFSRS